MARSGPDPNGPEDVDAAFAEIIADLEREGLGHDVEDDTERDAGDAAPGSGRDTGKDPGQDTPAGTPASGRPSSWRANDTEWDWAWSSDTEHYVPPEPPPFPKLRAGTIVAIVLALAGVFLLVAPGLVGLPLQISAPLALVLLASGLGLLLLRLRSGPPNNGPDHGAQL